MFVLSLFVVIASLIALFILHKAKKIDNTGAFVTLGVALCCAPSCILGDPLITILAPFLLILCIVGSLIMTKQSNQEIEAELRRDAARDAAGPAVVPLSEGELAEILDWVLAQFRDWCNGTHSHDSIVIACEPERMRFSGGGSTAYRPYSHRVFNDVYARCFSPSESDSRWDEQKAYRRQLSKRILELLVSQEPGHGSYGKKYSTSFWIDDAGDILGPWEKQNLMRS